MHSHVFLVEERMSHVASTGAIGGILSSSCSRVRSFRYSLPCGATKCTSTGESEAYARRFRSVPRSCPRPHRVLGNFFKFVIAIARIGLPHIWYWRVGLQKM